MVIKALVSEQLTDRLEALLVFPGANAGFKSWLLLRNIKLMNRLEELLDRLDDLNDGDEQQLIIVASVRFANKLINFTGAMYVCTVTSMSIAAFSSSEPVLMLKIWLPFDHSQTEMIHVCVLICQIIMTSYLGIVLLAGDLYSSVMYIILTAHLKVLRKRLINLGSRSTAAAGVRRNFRLRNNDEFNVAINNAELRKCIEIHCICIE